MHLLDYKNMRDLLKLLLVEKLDKMNCSLTEYQHQHLIPVEEVYFSIYKESYKDILNLFSWQST